MSKPIIVEKAELLARIQAGYAQFEALLAGLSEAQMTTAGVNGNWSIKDNIAHLTVWQNYMREQLQGVIADKKPGDFMPGLSSEDEQNEHIYQENKARPLSDVLATFRASYQQALEAVQTIREESLNKPFPWSEGDNPIWPFIVGNTYGHYEEHGDIIRRWLEHAM
jgi:hypothetical protein